MKRSERQLRTGIIALAGVCLAAIPCSAQQIKATVSFHTDRLAQEDKEYIAGLDVQLDRLLESQQWEGVRPKLSLPVQYDFFWDKAGRVGIARRYTVGLLVALQEEFSLRDKRVEFRFGQGDWIHLGEPYDPLTGVIEFYTWICLGFEADRTSPLGGSKFYEKARLIGERARSEAQYSLGWDDRRTLALDLTDSMYVTVRKARFYVAAGTYYAEAGIKSQAEANFGKALDLLLKCSLKQTKVHPGDHIIRFVDPAALLRSLQRMEMDEHASRLSEWYEKQHEGEEECIPLDNR